MLLKHTAFLRILVSASSLVASVSGHGRLVEPMGIEYMTDPCRGECAEKVIVSEAGSGDVLGSNNIAADSNSVPYQDPLALYRNHWFNQGSTIGCDKCSGTNCQDTAPSCCDKLMEPTLTSPDQLSYQKFGISNIDVVCELIAATTFNNSMEDCRDTLAVASEEQQKIDAEIAKGNFSASPFYQNPWMAPGHAPVEDACGFLGGWHWANARDFVAGPGNAFYNAIFTTSGFINAATPPVGTEPPGGTSGTSVVKYEVNMKMQNAQGLSTVTYDTVWTAGEAVNVSYSLGANHGGGHQFRLCPVENLYNDTLDEACFQANPMDFADGTSVFVGVSEEYGTVEIPFDAMDIDDTNTNGVLPTGSTWRKIGIPPCEGGAGGAIGCVQEPQFTDHAPPGGIYGFGTINPPELLSNSFNMTAFIPNFKVVDKVMVPKGLNGDYVVSWRWDAEQTAQVWTQCAIVTIIDPEQTLGGGDMETGGGETSGDAGGVEGECQSLIDIVCGSESFTLFCQALQDANLDQSFDEQTWTFFIPNDEAFESAQLVLEQLTDEQISNILMFHVVQDQVLMSDDLQCKEEIVMLTGKKSRTKCVGGGIYQNGAGNNALDYSPQVIQTDIGFCNGVAHVLDGVMIPPQILS